LPSAKAIIDTDIANEIVKWLRRMNVKEKEGEQVVSPFLLATA
jgi:hypothetical protein